MKIFSKDDPYYTYTDYSFCPPERKIPWLLVIICLLVVVSLIFWVSNSAGSVAFWLW